MHKIQSGEQATGACIGAHFPRLLCRSRLRLSAPTTAKAPVVGAPSAAAGIRWSAELPLCAALIRGGSISRHPPPTEKYGQGTKRPRVADLNRSLSRLPEVTVVFATDQICMSKARGLGDLPGEQTVTALSVTKRSNRDLRHPASFLSLRSKPLQSDSSA